MGIGRPVTPFKHLNDHESLAVTHPFLFRVNGQPIVGKVTFGYEPHTQFDHAPAVYPFGEYGYRFSTEDYNLDERAKKLAQPVRRYRADSKWRTDWRTIEVRFFGEDITETNNPLRQVETVLDLGQNTRTPILAGRIAGYSQDWGGTIRLFYPAESGPLASNGEFTHWTFNLNSRSEFPDEIGPGHVLEFTGVPGDLIKAISFTFMPIGDVKLNR